VDERCVPEYDAASNYGASKKDFLNRAPISENQIYPMPGMLSPEDGARQYQKALMEFFHLNYGQFPTFDQIFLGMGADGHIASLFPEHIAVNEKEKLVVAVKGGNPNVSRLTMTLPVLNSSRQIVFLVAGKGKAAAIKWVFEDGQHLLPAQKIRPMKGKTTWLLDKEAASLLPGEMIHE
jgi:6-phosphogluconolactonase